MNASALEALVANMSLAELSQRSGRSVEELVNWALGGGKTAVEKPAVEKPTLVRSEVASPVPKEAKPGKPGRRVITSEAPPSRREATGGKDVNTRTPEGRKRYSEAVLKLVEESKGSISATEIRDRLGGTPLQVRAALNRWIEAGKITYHGQARAMRYSPS